tara:strand:- start:142 stop:348 length:207 start_codon:yes stop_codon:yes gene_type:complete
MGLIFFDVRTNNNTNEMKFPTEAEPTIYRRSSYTNDVCENEQQLKDESMGGQTPPRKWLEIKSMNIIC